MTIVVFDRTELNVVRCVLRTDAENWVAATNAVSKILADNPDLADDQEALEAAIPAEFGVALVAWTGVSVREIV